jgi:hypothetical protein
MTPAVAQYMEASAQWQLVSGEIYDNEEQDMLDELDVMWYALTEDEKLEVDRLSAQNKDTE